MTMKTFSKVAIGVLIMGIAAGCTPIASSTSVKAEDYTSEAPLSNSGTTTSTTNLEVKDFTRISYAEAKGWQLDWHDEFDGKSVDESKWGWEKNCWGGGNNELQCYTDRYRNSFLEDGKLIIRAHKETFRGPAEPEDTNPNASTKTLPYTSARMRTKYKGDWKYGRIEVRAKLPAGQGIWPAIWMLPTDSKYGIWAASGEIDIIEMVSQDPDEPNKHVHGTLHYGQQWPKNVYSGETFVFEDSDPSKDFHTYAIEWADGEIRWYIDEKHYATQFGSGWYSQIQDETGDYYNVEGSAPFNERFHLLLNVAVGGNWPGAPDETVKFPVQMEVDYVRVYSCPGAKSSLRTCATKDRRAKRNFGKQPPDLATLNIKFDKDFWKADVVDIFNGESVPPFTASAWTGHGDIDVSLIEDEERGMVQQFKFNTDQGVGYWQSPGQTGFDFSGFKFLEFDLLRLADPRGTDGMFMKIDCFHPCSSGEVPMEPSPLGEWKTYRMALSDIKKNPGSSLNLGNVNTPFVIMPTWDNQNGVIVRVDNVRLVKE